MSRRCTDLWNNSHHCRSRLGNTRRPGCRNGRIRPWLLCRCKRARPDSGCSRPDNRLRRIRRRKRTGFPCTTRRRSRVPRSRAGPPPRTRCNGPPSRCRCRRRKRSLHRCTCRRNNSQSGRCCPRSTGRQAHRTSGTARCCTSDPCCCTRRHPPRRRSRRSLAPRTSRIFRRCKWSPARCRLDPGPSCSRADQGRRRCRTRPGYTNRRQVRCRFRPGPYRSPRRNSHRPGSRCPRSKACRGRRRPWPCLHRSRCPRPRRSARPPP